MFGFGKTNRDPLADFRSAEKWLASFPVADPLAMHAEVIAELGRMAEPVAKRTPQRLEAIFRVDAQCASLRKNLTAQYIEHSSRSSRIEHQLWSALFDLTQAFLVTYNTYAREVSLHSQSAKWQLLLPELIGRQIMHMGLDAKVRLYRYEQWIPAKWSELHAHFTLACSRQFERQQLVVSASGHSTTIEHEYLFTLLLHLMNAGNMSARHLEWVAGELDEWIAPLRMSVEPSSVTSFFVDLASREGLRRRLPQPLEGRVLFLDTRPLHATLMQNVVMIEQKIKAQPLSERTGKRSEQLGLLTKLASQVDPEFKPFARRGERTAAVGTVDAIVGFGKISGFLREEELAPVPYIEHGKSFGGTMELAVFGRMRNETDKRVEMSRRRLASFAAPGGPWEVKDISQTGFRMLAPMSVANAVTLGTLAAIRPHGQAPWTLGIVRRMKRMSADRAEIGLQVIANTLVGVDLIEQRKNLDADYSVDGEATTINGRTFQGLFLALKKREGDTSVQSLIVPAAEYQPTKRLKLLTSKSSSPIRFGRLLEQQSEWVWATIEPMELNTPIPTITGAMIPPTAANE
jgi:cyclic-di-GMP-binding protein